VQPSILIVDDEQLICWSLSEQLAREGYRIVQAETAAQATDRARDGIVRGELGKIRIATQDAPHNALANGAVARHSHCSLASRALHRISSSSGRKD
jgi:DNA-binding NtrC family response regulator